MSDYITKLQSVLVNHCFIMKRVVLLHDMSPKPKRSALCYHQKQRTVGTQTPKEFPIVPTTTYHSFSIQPHGLYYQGVKEEISIEPMSPSTEMTQQDWIEVIEYFNDILPTVD